MIFVLVVVVYLAGHLSLYLLWLRHRPALKREGGIAAFHGISYVMLTGGMLATALAGRDREAWAGLVLAAGLHGIYSLSFLELWSLTHRSYSLSILDKIDAAGGQIAADRLAGLQEVGAMKRTIRSNSLRRLGLFAPGSDSDVLTLRGWVCSRLLLAIRWVSNGRAMN